MTPPTRGGAIELRRLEVSVYLWQDSPDNTPELINRQGALVALELQATEADRRKGLGRVDVARIAHCERPGEIGSGAAHDWKQMCGGGCG